jgi:hypothetical protein
MIIRHCEHCGDRTSHTEETDYVRGKIHWATRFSFICDWCGRKTSTIELRNAVNFTELRVKDCRVCKQPRLMRVAIFCEKNVRILKCINCDTENEEDLGEHQDKE